MQNQIDQLIMQQRYAEAMPLLQQQIKTNPNDWHSWYLIGQCFRFMGVIDKAIKCLSNSITLNEQAPFVYHALGIAYQQDQQYENAINMFRVAIQKDSECELAYNSLALTQKIIGQYDLALHNYDSAAKALTRRIIANMINDKSNRIYKHVTIPHYIWVKHCIYGATYFCAIDGIECLAIPTGESALFEEQNEIQDGLYWNNFSLDEKPTRQYLPNFFATFPRILMKDATYSNLIGNRGTVLQILGNHQEALLHFQEAEYFLPAGT